MSTLDRRTALLAGAAVSVLFSSAARAAAAK